MTQPWQWAVAAPASPGSGLLSEPAASSCAKTTGDVVARWPSSWAKLTVKSATEQNTATIARMMRDFRDSDHPWTTTANLHAMAFEP